MTPPRADETNTRTTSRRFRLSANQRTIRPTNKGGIIMQATRDLTTKIYWYKDRHCWRFPYRDPETQERKFLFCTPDKFARAGIDLPFPDVVRKDTQTAHGLCKRLQNVFLRSLAAIELEPGPIAPAAPAR